MLKNFTIAAPAIAGQPKASPLSLGATGGRATLGDAGASLSLWLDRCRSRRVLAMLDDRQLEDIGLTRAEASRESEKPFWKA